MKRTGIETDRDHGPQRRHRTALGICCLLGALGCGAETPSTPSSGHVSQAEKPGVEASDPAIAGLGEGFVVWESNRTGDWRIWIRRLDGSLLRQLSPDGDGQQHCCPHISPDGQRVLYLSRAVPKDRYPKREVAGELLLIAVDGSAPQTLARARTYGWGNRAAVWRNDGELIYVDAKGRTMLLDLDRGRSTALLPQPREELGWLVDPTLRYATNAAPSFPPYDGERRQVAEQRIFGGCEPYFSHDGRWGFWVAGAGGPIHRIDLASRQVSIMLRMNDPRMPGEQGYLYFPMPSRDGRLFAFGASAGGHDHSTSDYDVYVAPTDPRSFELLADPVRLTVDPASDRYPDVFAEPLELGRHAGEAPLTLDFAPPGSSGEREWDYGDGARERAAVGRHTYREAGTYEVRARGGGELLRAQVLVAAPRPPQAVGAVVRAAGRQIVVHFDEKVRFEDPVISLESGLAIAGWRAGDDGRSLVVDLARALTSADRLHLRGVSDRAQVPNPMPDAELGIEAPSWPSDRGDLVFLWQTGDQSNLVYDPQTEVERTYSPEPRGRARLDHHYAMVLGGGAFAAPEEAADALLRAVKASNELTLEATVRTADTSPSAAGIIAFSTGLRQRDLVFGQLGNDLFLRIRTDEKCSAADCPLVRLFSVAPGKEVHVALTYSPGRLAIYRDGERVRLGDELQLNFYKWKTGKWKPCQLVFGEGVGGEGDWSGRLEGIALSSRIAAPAEVRENFLRYRKLRQERPRVPRLVVRGRLRASSAVPTLREISPYRQALAVYEYEVGTVVEGEYAPGRLRVAHWVILDEETLPIATAVAGEAARLVVEPFAANPQLESQYLSDTLEAAPELRLYYDVGEP